MPNRPAEPKSQVSVRASLVDLATAQVLADMQRQTRHSVLCDALSRGLAEITAPALEPGHARLVPLPRAGATGPTVELRIRVDQDPWLLHCLTSVLFAADPDWNT